MHAYIIVSKFPDDLYADTEKHIDLKSYKLVPFELKSISDARSLIAFLKLSLPERTAIVIKNFEEVTEECSNSLLKTLEEPQENLIFLIHTRNENLILPTIRSRCKILRITKPSANEDLSDIKEFLEMSLFDKYSFLNKMKRDDAQNFSGKMIKFLVANFKQFPKTYRMETLKNAVVLKKNLHANGNTNLQLLKFLSDVTVDV